jgi:hypothetical protein
MKVESHEVWSLEQAEVLWYGFLYSCTLCLTALKARPVTTAQNDWMTVNNLSGRNVEENEPNLRYYYGRLLEGGNH